MYHYLESSVSHVQLFVTPWTVAYQAPPSMGFSRQEYWSGLPFPSPGDLPDPGIEARSPTLQADALTSEPPGKPIKQFLTPQVPLCCPFIIIFCCSVTESYLTLSNPLRNSLAGSPVLLYLPEFAQIHVHWVVMLSNYLILCHPFLLLPSVFPSIRLLSWLFTSGGQSIGASASASVLPMNIQSWFHLVLTGLISLLSKGLSRVFSSPIQKHQFFGFLYGTTLTSIYDYWKKQNFNYMDLCQQFQRECFQTHSMRPAFILISKPKSETLLKKKLWANITDGRVHKNPQQNISKPKSMIH